MEGMIKIEEYKTRCLIGVLENEKTEPQEIAFDIEMRVDFSECVLTDSIVDTVDYTQIVKICSELAQTRHYHLLETLCFEAVHALMDAFSPSWVQVRVKKRSAIPGANAAIVEIGLAR